MSIIPLKGRIHFVEDNRLIMSRGYDVLISLNCGVTWEKIFQIPICTLFDRISDNFKLLQRLLRRGIHHVYPVKENSLLIMADQRLFRYDFSTDTLSKQTISFKGSRPLVLAKDGNDYIYFGEYFSNPERNPVNVFRNIDGSSSWQIIHRFDGIRHVHGVFFDSYTNSMWITTGDTDKESIIWMTQDNFASVEKVISGNQQTRALQLLFTKSHVYFGSDAPSETNHIYRMERRSCRIESLQTVEGSVFYGCKVKDNLFFSTAVEPSDVNRDMYACLWGSRDGFNWKRIARFRKDIWHKKIFQYGQILFPAGDNQTNKLWFTPMATAYDYTVQSIDLAEIDWS